MNRFKNYASRKSLPPRVFLILKLFIVLNFQWEILYSEKGNQEFCLHVSELGLLG
jgi:hypothetical protein